MGARLRRAYMLLARICSYVEASLPGMGESLPSITTVKKKSATVQQNECRVETK
jgi:hypothetical protein